jgi:hypothetical protein
MHWKSIAAQPEINRYVAAVEAASDLRSFRGNGVIEGWGRHFHRLRSDRACRQRLQIGIADRWRWVRISRCPRSTDHRFFCYSP